MTDQRGRIASKAASKSRPQDDVARLAAIVAMQHQVAVANLDLVRIMSLIAEQALTLTGAGGAVIELAEGDEMVYRAAAGSVVPFLGLRLMSAGSLSGECVRTGEVLRCDDSETDSRVDIEACRKVGARSMVVVPLRTGGQVAGVLKVLAPEPSRFGEKDVWSLRLMAGTLAAAMLHAGEFKAKQDLVNDLTATLQQLRARDEAISKLNRELAQASNHKSEFLAGMSHELRTPLNSILGFSELLLDPGRNYSEEKRATYLGTIRRSGEHLLGLINDILDLSKIEAGRVTVEPETLAVAELLAQAASSVESLAAAKSIQVQVGAAAELRVRADPRHLRQILLNLVGNALKFTPEKGSILLTARAAGDEVVISVADDGPGIASEDQDRVFRAFEQAAGAANVTGTGLGLDLSRRLAEMNGGRISLYSAPGEGSTFSVTFPAQEFEWASELPPEWAETSERRPVVLVVEDEPESSAMLADQLARAGYQVEVATDGDAAVAMARRLRPVAITLDIVLPNMHGWDVLSALKGGPSTRDIPVIVVSMVDNRPLGRALGAVDYFVKPIDPQLLVARLSAVGLSASRRHRVLVIDDEPADRERAQEMLENAGCEVLAAASGAHGIATATEHLPDLILTDLVMPGMSGFDVIDHLKSVPETAGIPILVLTAKELSDQDREELASHAAAIFSKDTAGTFDVMQQLEALQRTSPGSWRGLGPGLTQPS